MNADHVLSKLQGVKPAGDGRWQARCPAHEDTNPSLSIAAKSDRILLHCQAGCGFKEVVESIGLTVKDLFADNGTDRRAPKAADGALGEIVATYDYTDPDGHLLYQVVRFSPKNFRQRRPDPTAPGGWTWNLTGIDRVLYRLPEVLAARDSGMTIFIVEGEKDADALAALGLIATTNPGGAGKWKTSYADTLASAAVCILPDNDTPGREHADQVAAALAGKCSSVKALALPGLPAKGDVTDWLAAGGGPEELVRLADAAPAWTPKAPETPVAASNVIHLAPPFEEAISAALPIPASDINAYPPTDSGNGELFAALYGNRVKHQKRGADRIFESHVWREPRDGEMDQLAKELARHRALAACMAPDQNHRRALANWAIKSEHQAGKNNTLAAARATPPIADDDQPWDEDNDLCGAPNGIINLRDGTIRPGRPEDKITRAVTIPFDPAISCPRWTRFLDEVFEGDNALIDFMQRSIGYSLTGHTREQCLWVLYGIGGNGKSTLINTLRRILGPYQIKTAFSTFELSRISGGEKASPDIAAIEGVRLVVASEANEGIRLDAAKIKELTGGDAVTSRHLREEYFTFIPKCKIWLMVNNKPVVKDDSRGFWRRVRLVPFNRNFDPHQEPTLEATLISEAPGILAWAIRGAVAWHDHGLANPPACVMSATADYQTESDALADWKRECCIERKGDCIAGRDAYASYTAWAEKEKLSPREILSKLNFGRKLSAVFMSKHTRSGVMYWGFSVAGQDQLSLNLGGKNEGL